MRARRTLVVVAALAVAAAGAVSAGAANRPASISGPGGGDLRPADRVTPPPRRASFAFVGDVLTHRPINRAAQRSDGSFDYRPMFARVAPLLDHIDIPVCHLEQPVAPPGTAVLVGPDIHSSAASIGVALRGAGFRRCSTASNHNLDRGIAGIDATVDALETAGLGQSGLARTPGEAVPALFDVNGITAAHLSYTYSIGGTIPPDQVWRVNRIDTAAIAAAARDARARGADIVIASLHWGAAMHVAPTADQRRVAHAITAAGDIDLVVGHHAHVLQPIEQVNGTWVVWGLGNFLANMPTRVFSSPATQDGAVVTVAVAMDRDGVITVGRPSVAATWVDRDRGFVIRPTAEADDPAVPASTRHQLRLSEARTRSLLGEFMAPP